MGIRTDLAIESTQSFTESPSHKIEGLEQESYEAAGCKITKISITSESTAKKIDKPIGNYITLESLSDSLDNQHDMFEDQVMALSKEIINLCKCTDNVLVVGLGNTNITPDSLGPRVASQIFATRHIQGTNISELLQTDINTVSALATGVLGQTGIEVAEIISAVCEKVKPSAVIAIDALACSELSRLGTTVQMTDTGISPGSGVQNARKELSQATLNVPCVAIGVPTVVDLQTIVETLTGDEFENSEYRSVMVTPRTIDQLVERTAKLISMSINKAFQPDLTIEEIMSLI